MAAGIVAGIGFLGAGVIFRAMRADVPMGLTTSASVWITAAIGMAAGVGLYLVAAIVTVISLLVLLIPDIQGLMHQLKEVTSLTLTEKILAAHSGKSEVIPASS